MRTFMIYCPEIPDRLEGALKHFRDMGVEGVELVRGIHAQTFGILAWRPYTVDYPKDGFLIPMKHVGLTLSHYMVWTACSLIHDEDEFFILEDDAEFPVGWKERFDEQKALLPQDWDIVLFGSGNCTDKPMDRIVGDIHVVQYPFCTHAYMVRKKALPVMLDEFRDASTKIDVGLVTKIYPRLRVYTVHPRIIHQRGTELMP